MTIGLVAVLCQTIGEKILYISTSSAAKDKLKIAGAKLVYTTHLFSSIDRLISRKYSGITITQFIGQVLKMFGEGFKVCAEIAVMVADCGASLLMKRLSQLRVRAEVVNGNSAYTCSHQ